MPTSVSKKKKKKTQAWYRRKCMDIVKAKVREHGYCEYCGAQSPFVQLQGAHILPETYHSTCAEPKNILCLCAKCHKWNKGSWHKSPEIAIWFYRNQRKRYEELEVMKYWPEPNWEEKYEELKKTAP